MSTSNTRRASRAAALLVVALTAACRGADRTDQQVSRVGSVVPLPPGSLLRAAPGDAPSLATRGSPALVLEENAAGQLRVLAADGAVGWTDPSAVTGQAVRAEGRQRVSAADRSPDDVAPPNTIDLEPPIHVTGASRRSAVASVQQNMVPAWRNWLNAPWLQLLAGKTVGWAPPSELNLSWDGPLRPDGLVRPPFTASLSSLVANTTNTAPVFRVDEAGGSASTDKVPPGESFPEVWSAQMSGAEPTAVLLSGERGRLLRLRTGSLLFTTYPPELDRAECADLGGDGAVECFAEVTQLSGDGPFRTLWIVTRSAAAAFPLQASGGETTDGPHEAEWGFDRDGASLWIVRADATTTRVTAIGRELKEARIGAVAAGLPAQDTPEEAMASNIRIAGNQLAILPVAVGGRVKWTAGRPFRSAEDAERWRRSIPAGWGVTTIPLPAR